MARFWVFLVSFLAFLTVPTCADARYISNIYDRLREPVYKLPSIAALFRQRNLQAINQTAGTGVEQCNLCANYTLHSDFRPPYEADDGLPPGLTCQELSDAASDFAVDSFACLAFRNGFFSPCCDGPPLYQCESRVRSEVLESYDPMVPPISEAGHVNISLQLLYFHTTELDIQQGTVEIFVWIVLLWTDPRLAWGWGPEHCTTFTTFRASLNAETTEIWVPDFDLYNMASGVQNLPEAAAEVYADGTVVWRRNGGIKALCLLAGLKKIPFDTLGCRFMFGSWTRFNGQINYILGGEIGSSGFESYAEKPKYNEYRLEPSMTQVAYSDPPYLHNVHFDLYFVRARRHYVISITVPVIIFTFLSFGVYLLDLRVGERLSFGISLLLVLVANQIVIGSLLPVTNARLWLVVLVNGSYFWVVVGIVESLIVAHLFFKEHNTDRTQPDAGQQLTIPEEGTGDLGMSATDLQQLDGRTPSSENIQGAQSRRRLQRSRLESVRSIFTLKQAMRGRGATNPYRKLIRKLDKWCFRIAVATYALFLTILFATLPLWDETGEDVWGYEQTSEL